MIKNLDQKLSGELPVTREELIKLISSWGRIKCIMGDTFVNASETKECYDLSKLDVSKIEDLSCIFGGSKFNGDLSKWNVSNCINMNYMFYNSKFDGDISLWKFNKNVVCNSIFNVNNNFIKKYDVIEKINITQSFLSWFEDNKLKMWEINVNNNQTKKDVEDYLLSFEIEKGNVNL